MPGWSEVEAVARLGLGSAGLPLLLAGCRCGPLLLAVPLLGVGGRVAALILGTLLVAPLLAPAIPAELAGPELLGLGTALVPLCLRELLIGGTLALAAALPWAVAHSVGALVAAGRPTGAWESPRSREAAALYGALALALFFGLGGARTAISALAASYELLPLPTLQHPLTEPLPGSLGGSARGLILLSGQLLWIAIRLALPLLGAQLLAVLLITFCALGRTGKSYQSARRPSPMHSLIWLGVLTLGVHELFPEFRKLLILWPSLLRLALATR